MYVVSLIIYICIICFKYKCIHNMCTCWRVYLILIQRIKFWFKKSNCTVRKLADIHRSRCTDRKPRFCYSRVYKTIPNTIFGKYQANVLKIDSYRVFRAYVNVQFKVNICMEPIKYYVRVSPKILSYRIQKLKSIFTEGSQF